MANAMKKVPIPDVRGLRPEVPEVVVKLVAKMCAIDRNERVSSLQEVATALSPWQ